MTPIGEFVSAETREAKADYNGEEHRTHERTSLQQAKPENLSMACDGITINLFKRSLFGFKRKTGIASVKDISIGGLGFLCNSQLELGGELMVKIEGVDLNMQVVRSVPVNSRLNFYGCKWLAQPKDKIVELINRVQTQIKNKQKS